uniref:Hexosyltransferase n=1 Tax=Ananas comosus var. bracteatus TaxID=296719 RepID=A0A6V7Q073_ANACO|nr:unnamed protein product [Ananas comosus var. bracteatus]
MCTVAKYKEAYASSIAPLPSCDQWVKIDIGHRVLPPILNRPAGRPRNKRIRGSDEMTIRKRHRCKRCNKLGHRAKTCKNPVDANQQPAAGPSQAANQQPAAAPSQATNQQRAYRTISKLRALANPSNGDPKPYPQISSSYSFFAVAAAAVVALLLLAPPSSAAAAARSDPLRARAELIRKQASDHAAVAATYASFARKLKLETSKQVRLFADLSRNFSLLLSPSSSAAAAAAAMDEAELRRFEREVKDRIRAARAVIADAKGAFDAQLKIQRLKDAIFAANERLSKAKKQGAFSSLIAAKSIPRSLHCLAVRLTEERIAHPALYSPPPPPARARRPRLFHYAIFSDNVLAASVVVNSAVRNAKEPSKHVFHVVTDRMNLGAMQVMFRRGDYAGAHVEVRAVEDYTFLNSSYVPVLRQLESANLQRFYFENKLENATKDTTNMKFRNPKYLSMLNHLRFYLPRCTRSCTGSSSWTTMWWCSAISRGCGRSTWTGR